MEPQRIGIIGGTGPQGKGLGYRLASRGHRIVVGSRSRERAEQTAAEIGARIEGASVRGLTNDEAAAGADIVIVAVPYEGHADLVQSLADALSGKVLVSCVNPLGFDNRGPYGLRTPDGSAAEEAARLAPNARVVGAFHHLSAPNLWNDGPHLADEDVLVCGDDADAKATVIELVHDVTAGRGVDAGALRMARVLEPLTAVLISVNKKYRVRSGIALTGLSEPTQR